MYVDPEEDDSVMQIDDQGSEFEEGGAKKKKAPRKPRGEVNKKAKWTDVCDEEGNDLEEKKKQRLLKKEINEKKRLQRAAQKEA